MTEFDVVTLEPQPAAVVRGEVPMSEVGTIFDRAFGEVVGVLEAQGLTPTGPPFGFYPRMPGETVEVAAGFPASGTVTPSGDVTPMELPGGRAVRGVHVGSYETLERTYGELLEWARAQGLELAERMWESYLTDPGAEPDSSKWRTEVTWPLAEG